uniref:NADH dehydrogenase [ubiquinone] 1 beta subcomplex subunit 4 n=1 Tax=Catharus ustulatus TaxID=91951 RepID=A0A8C3TUW3_CATUS
SSAWRPGAEPAPAAVLGTGAVPAGRCPPSPCPWCPFPVCLGLSRRVEVPRQIPAGLTAVLFAPQEDPALLRWAYAKSQNVYPTFRPTPKTSFLGAAYALGPLLFWIFVLKADRDCKEKRIQEGKYKRPFSVFF